MSDNSIGLELLSSCKRALFALWDDDSPNKAVSILCAAIEKVEPGWMATYRQGKELELSEIREAERKKP